MIAPKETAELENERAWLHDMVNTPGWKIYLANRNERLNACSKQLRERDHDKRDWTAGLVSGFEQVMDWPLARIATLDAMLAKRVA